MSPAAPPARPAPQRGPYCEIDGLPVEVDPTEIDSAGLFIETPQPAAIDSEVELFLRIGEQRFQARGQVVKSVSCASAKSLGKRPGYAVLFTSFEQGTRERLSAAIVALAAAAPPRRTPPQASPRPPSAAPAAPAKQPVGGVRAGASPANTPSAHSANDNHATESRAAASSSPSAHSAAKSGAPAPADEPALLARLTVELAALGAKPPWSVLGVSQSATVEELRTAFFAASKRYHPHLYARYPHPDVKRVVTELFIAHKRAYTNLLKAGKGHRGTRP